MLRKVALIAPMVFFAAPVFPSEISEQKHLSFGVATFATVIRSDNGFVEQDDDFSGFALYGTGAVNDHLGIRLLYANQSHDDVSGVDLKALEGSIIAGTGLATSGFKAYGAVGFFDETLEFDGFSGEADFSGLMLGGGIGYNWNPVALDFWINVRDASDYEDFAGGGVDVAAASGGLGLSARF